MNRKKKKILISMLYYYYFHKVFQIVYLLFICFFVQLIIEYQTKLKLDIFFLRLFKMIVISCIKRFLLLVCIDIYLWQSRVFDFIL